MGIPVFTVRVFQLDGMFKFFHNKVLQRILSRCIVDLTHSMFLKDEWENKIK